MAIALGRSYRTTTPKSRILDFPTLSYSLIPDLKAGQHCKPLTADKRQFRSVFAFRIDLTRSAS